MVQHILHVSPKTQYYINIIFINIYTVISFSNIIILYNKIRFNKSLYILSDLPWVINYTNHVWINITENCINYLIHLKPHVSNIFFLYLSVFTHCQKTVEIFARIVTFCESRSSFSSCRQRTISTIDLLIISYSPNPHLIWVPLPPSFS